MPISLQMIYFGAAVVGGFLLVIQILMALFGGDADADAGLDADALDGAGLSFRTAVAFVTFFGIAGMACTRAGMGWLPTLLVAVGAGGIAFWLVGLGMYQLSRLRSQGNLDIQNAVGAEGRVYLTVPAERTGAGTVTVPIQGRTAQFRAITVGPALPTGRICKVVGVHAEGTLEVEAI